MGRLIRETNHLHSFAVNWTGLACHDEAHAVADVTIEHHMGKDQSTEFNALAKGKAKVDAKLKAVPRDNDVETEVAMHRDEANSSMSVTIKEPNNICAEPPREKLRECSDEEVILFKGYSYCSLLLNHRISPYRMRKIATGSQCRCCPNDSRTYNSASHRAVFVPSYLQTSMHSNTEPWPNTATTTAQRLFTFNAQPTPTTRRFLQTSRSTLTRQL